MVKECKGVKNKSGKVFELLNKERIDKFFSGKELKAYEFMGAHLVTENGKSGVRFTVWGRNASKITLIGDFNNWELREEYELEKVDDRGLFSIFVPKLKEGMKYKYAVTNRWGNNTVYKADPFAFQSELRPKTASLIKRIKKYRWGDKRWLNNREKENLDNSPMNIYEIHLGSWKRKDGKFLSYEEIKEMLIPHLKYMGYTHVEFMPLTEHPLDASWGYQATGYYSMTKRFGDLEGLKDLINALHKEKIGVIFDWVPSHFCKDEHGLYMFDGSPTFEYDADWKAQNKGWGTCNFDLGRPEVKSFLFSNASFFINELHVDGIRVDAVSNMLYLDYGRDSGEWEPNIYGDNGNLEAIGFLKELNTIIEHKYKGVITIAEESTAWKGITEKVLEGGLGFNYKWNMGWMNDTLRYIKRDPVYRKYHHNEMNFSMVYNYTEKFILPISHDEVVHGKGSLIGKMLGDDWRKYAGLRLYGAFMIGHPGKKLMFMGQEFGQFVEWREWEELQWNIIDEYPIHKQTLEYFKDLNSFYKENKSLWELDYDKEGFRWIDADDSNRSIFSFIRKAKDDRDICICIYNFTPEVYRDVKVGVPYKGVYEEAFNSDLFKYGGADNKFSEKFNSIEEVSQGFDNSIKVTVPPLGAIFFKFKG